jgi:hypothetical protein
MLLKYHFKYSPAAAPSGSLYSSRGQGAADDQRRNLLIYAYCPVAAWYCAMTLDGTRAAPALRPRPAVRRPGPPSCLRQPRIRPPARQQAPARERGIPGSARSRADFRAGAGVPARELVDQREQRIAGPRRPLGQAKTATPATQSHRKTHRTGHSVRMQPRSTRNL